jgi:hypothetical protein
LDYSKARHHAATALAYSAGGNHAGASAAHTKAASAHERGYADALMDGDEDMASRHYDAAQAHRAAAAWHDDQDEDNDQEADDQPTGNADPFMLPLHFVEDVDALLGNASETADSNAPSYDRTQGGAGSRQVGRGGLEDEDEDLSGETVSSASDLFADDEPDDLTRQNWQRIGLLPQPTGSPGFEPMQGRGRDAGQYSPTNQISSENPYFVRNAADHGLIEEDALPLPSTMAGVMAFNRAGRKEPTANLEPPDPMKLDYLPIPGET